MSKTNYKESKSRVLISGSLPPPIGGVGTFYADLLSSSLPKLVDLVFIQTTSHVRPFEKSGRFSFSNIILSLRDCFQFLKYLLKYHPQIVHIGTACGLSFLKNSIYVLMARCFPAKVLLHPHCSLASLYHTKPRLWKWYFRIVIDLTHGIVALSKEWLTLPQIVPGVMVYSLPNAINLKPYLRIAGDRNKPIVSSNPLNILYLGHIGRSKGTYDLLEAADISSHKDLRWKYRIIGGELTQGERDSLLKITKSKELDDCVTIENSVTGADKFDLFTWADIFVLPSYGEGMPISIIEAMASGLPVVASRVGGIPDLVTDGKNGFLVEPGHPEQIVDSIRKIEESPELRLSMGRNGFERAVREYDIEMRARELVEIYHSLTG